VKERRGKFRLVEFVPLNELEAYKVNFSSTIKIRVGFEVVPGGNRKVKPSSSSHCRKRRRCGSYSVSLSFPCRADCTVVVVWPLEGVGHLLE
jgi:hypothetical protein